MKDLSPKIEYYTVTVSVFLDLPISPIKARNISEAEEFLRQKRNCEVIRSQIACIDRARDLLKWAEDCKSRLYDMYYSSPNIVFKFGFDELENMENFVQKMGEKVS